MESVKTVVVDPTKTVRLESQFKEFASRKMKDGASIPFHIAVPKNIKGEMKQKLREIGPGEKLDSGRISVWY